MMSIWKKWYVDGHKIGFYQKVRHFFVFGRKPHFKFGVLFYIMVKNFHIESAVSDLSYKRANSTQTNDSYCLPPNLWAQETHWFPLFVFSPADKFICFNNSFCYSHQKSKRMFSYCFSKNSRRIGNENLSFGCCFYINIVIAHGVISDNFYVKAATERKI